MCGPARRISGIGLDSAAASTAAPGPGRRASHSGNCRRQGPSSSGRSRRCWVLAFGHRRSANRPGQVVTESPRPPRTPPHRSQCNRRSEGLLAASGPGDGREAEGVGGVVADQHKDGRRRPPSPLPQVVFSDAPAPACTPTPTASAPASVPVAPPPASTAPPETGARAAGYGYAASRGLGTREKGTFQVHVRSVNDPKPGWTVERALDQLARGYSIEHVSSLSGYVPPFLHAQLRRTGRSHERG